MIRLRALFSRPAAVAVALVVCVACSSGSSTPTAPPTNPTPTPSSTPAPAPTPIQGCPLGLGSGRYTCQGGPPGLLPYLEAAIDKLVADHPELFGLENPPAAGGFLIYDVDAFYDGVIDNLTAAGLCAQRTVGDGERIQIKEDNSYAEAYDIVSSQNRIRRGPATYVNTCTPANFPLTADIAVANVSVSFFRYNFCPPTTVFPVPHNTLPIGCRGTITATPRDAQGNKLPPELHGSEVLWFFRAGEGTTVAPGPSPDGVPFNLVLEGRDVGPFSVCATVSNRTGCLNGQVTPQ